MIRRAKGAICRAVCDESGGEVIEWVLIAGLIIVATITTIFAVGTKVLARWTSVNSSM
jgi:pilus assembly protein Flp/PilA